MNADPLDELLNAETDQDTTKDAELGQQDTGAGDEDRTTVINTEVASQLRTHLIELHQIDDQLAATLITGTDPDTVTAQVSALVGLQQAAQQRPASAPKLGTTNTNTKPLFTDPVSAALDAHRNR